jgi:predicted GNAT family N-acyltransferase
MTPSQLHEGTDFKTEILQDPSSLTQEQLQTLIEQLKTESALLTERLSVEDLQKLIEQNQLTAILDNDQNIIASAMLWKVPNQSNWYEIGTVWVSPEHRGQQLGYKVFRSITEMIPWDSNAFLLTATPQIIYLANKLGYGFVEKDFFEQNEFAIIPPAEEKHLLYAYYQTEFTTAVTLNKLRNNYSI